MIGAVFLKCGVVLESFLSVWGLLLNHGPAVLETLHIGLKDPTSTARSFA